MTSVFTAGLVIAGLIAAGILPTMLLTGRSITSLFLAPIVTAVFATIAGILTVVTGTALLPWVVAIFLLVNGAALVFIRRRGISDKQPAGSLLSSGLVAIAAILPVAAMRGPQLGWDARSMWLEHASWFFGGGDFTRSAMGNLAYEFTSREYPPLISSVAGGVWSVSNHLNLIVGSQAIALLNVCAVALIGLAFVQLFHRRFGAASGVAGALVCLSAYGFSHSVSASGQNIAVNGYADLLWSAAAVAGALYLLVLPRDRTNFLVGIIVSTAAGLTKNEGLLVSLLIIALALVRYRADLRRHALVGAGAGALIISWPILAQLLNAGSVFLKGAPGVYGFGVDPSRHSGPMALLRGDPDVWNRLDPTFFFLNPYYLRLAGIAAACSIVGLLAFRTSRRKLGLESSAWTWIVFLGALAFIAAAYLISPYDLAWHAGTSVDRTTIVLRLFSICEIAVWTMCALAYIFERAASWRRPVLILRDPGSPTGAAYGLEIRFARPSDADTESPVSGPADRPEPSS